MIRRETVDGRSAIVAYITEEWEPAKPENATMAKVIFDDGDVMFLLSLRPNEEEPPPLE